MDNQQIEIRRKKPPYTQLPNRLIWDAALRPQTRWILIAMLSLPEDWDYSIRGLAAKTGLSKDTVAKMMAELEEAGYLKRKRQPHDDGGRFGRIAYILTDVAFDFSEDADGGAEAEKCPDFPYTAPPYTENSPQQNTIQQTNQQEPPIVPQRGRRGQPSPDWALFDKFWGEYPRKEAKERARRAWKKLSPTPEMAGVMLAALERDKRSRQWTKDKGEFIPLPASWLNGRRWEDEKPSGPDTGPGQPLRGEGVRYL